MHGRHTATRMWEMNRALGAGGGSCEGSIGCRSGHDAQLMPLKRGAKRRESARELRSPRRPCGPRSCHVGWVGPGCVPRRIPRCASPSLAWFRQLQRSWPSRFLPVDAPVAAAEAPLATMHRRAPRRDRPAAAPGQLRPAAAAAAPLPDRGQARPPAPAAAPAALRPAAGSRATTCTSASTAPAPAPPSAPRTRFRAIPPSSAPRGSAAPIPAGPPRGRASAT